MGARRRPAAPGPAHGPRARAAGLATAATLAVAALLVVAALLTACGAPAPDDEPPPPTAASATAGTVSVDLDGRPFRLHVPAGYDPARPAPLLVGLHGYTSTSGELDDYLHLTRASDERGFLLALPEGRTDPAGDQFWNAVGHGCCDFYGAGVDDVAYLSGLIDHVRSSYAVGTVAVVGHSNGGYMAMRLACDRPGEVDAIASIAGPLGWDTSACRPDEPVRVLHVHGDADETVAYGGSAARGSASAADTVARWVELDGCSPAPGTLPALDLEASLPGAETTVARYADGCRDGGEVQLWTVEGGRHVPAWSDAATPAILDFLLGAA